MTWQGIIGVLDSNKEKFPGGLRSVSDLSKTELKGRVEVLSEMRDTIGLIMLEQGVDIAGPFTDAQFQAALDEVEKQISQAETQIAGIDPVQRDELMKQQTGMTWDEAKAHDRGQVNLLLFVNIGLSIVYFGMWIWAKRNALAASVTALLLFITVIVVNGVYDPKTLPQGIIVKIFFIGALAKAISAAQEERRLTRS